MAHMLASLVKYFISGASSVVDTYKLQCKTQQKYINQPVNCQRLEMLAYFIYGITILLVCCVVNPLLY